MPLRRFSLGSMVLLSAVLLSSCSFLQKIPFLGGGSTSSSASSAAASDQSSVAAVAASGGEAGSQMVQENQEGSDQQAGQQPSTELHLSLSREKRTDNDGNEITNARLHLTGVITQDIPFWEGYGDLLHVDPAVYTQQTTVAAFSSWWAGAGDEIVVSHQGDLLVVYRRSGDEGGSCTPWLLTVNLPLPAGTSVVVDDAGEMTTQSSLSFCK